MNLAWDEYDNTCFLCNLNTGRNEAWLVRRGDGWVVHRWDETNKRRPDWVELGVVPDLDAAKMIARLNVEGDT